MVVLIIDTELKYRRKKSQSDLDGNFPFELCASSLPSMFMGMNYNHHKNDNLI